MKNLMLGNQAIAQGLKDFGVGFVSSYPGTPSTEITEYASKICNNAHCEWAPNEKVAMESAFGASLAGYRSFCAMKHVGLNVAADPLFTLSYTGINAGMIICVADDPGMHSSQNEQDSRFYAMSSRIPMIEPSDSQECHDFVDLAFKLSEKFDTPVLLKTCTRVAHSQSIVDYEECPAFFYNDYDINPQKNVMVPAMAKQKHPIVEKRIDDIEEWSYSTNLNFIDDGEDTSIGIIADSTSYQYVKEVFGDKYPVLKIGMVYPLPEKTIKDFAQKVDQIYVIEELSPFIEMQVKSFGLACKGKDVTSKIGEFSQRTVEKAFGLDLKEGKKVNEDIPNRPPALCSGCPHRGIFYTLNKLKLNVFGDIGCYTLGMQAPLNAVHTALCMGASVSGLHGFAKASYGNKLAKYNWENSVAVIGDSTFAHSGITGLLNAAYNQSNSTIIILDNSITGMTGHQNNPVNGFDIYGEPAGQLDIEKLCDSMGIQRVTVVDPYNLEQLEKVIKQEVATPEVSVIISRRPCVLLKSIKSPGPIKINPDKCIGCKMCLKLGCPAISFKDGKAHIDQNMCFGCNVCKQICKKEAIDD